MNLIEMTTAPKQTFKCVAVNNTTKGRQVFYCSSRDKALREAKTYLKCNRLTNQYTIIDPVPVFSTNNYTNEIY